MAVNCSERKKPPTTSRIMISSNGVAIVNSAQAARKIELTTALMVMMLRKPKVRIIRAASVFMPIAPTAAAKVTSPERGAEKPNAARHKERQKKRRGADAEAEQKPADNAGAHRRQPQQREIQHR